MIYPADFENKIGFDIVRNLLSEQCLSPLGQRRVKSMSFSDDYEKVRRMLTQTSEMLTLLTSANDLPVNHIFDVTPSLKAIQAQGSWMPPIELYRLRLSLETIAQVHTFFVRKDEEGNNISAELSKLFSGIAVFPNIVTAIDKIVNKFGEIADNASPALYDLRRRISASSASLSSIMQRVVSRGVADGILDKDTAPSVRDGRLVIPINAAVKRKIPGIVHDESATGKTSFIEPVEVVEASNRLRELREAEKREIQRLLVDIADFLRPSVPDMLKSYSMLGVYDFIRAKALIARQFEAQMPILETKPEIDWYGAVHPVLALSLKAQGREVVPLSIKLNSKDRILIISGPNAGGKSVCLKTAGIVQYMLQCGMLPTIHSNSHACLFKNILIDIGDEQSIENDLSTYSSHLQNMKVFLQNATSRTFLLVDEMGSGTEPQIGGALAQAILKQLNESKVMGIVTTHYQNLKTFADSEPGFVNGAMLYDRQHMQPLFKLSIGNPGSSFALEIANKTGLPKKVIDDAREIVGSDYVNMDKYLLDLARDRRYWNNKRQSIKEKEAKVDALLERLEDRASNIKSEKREIIEQARKQAQEILSDANARIERTVKEIRDAQAEKERTKQIRRQLDEYKRQITQSNQGDVQINVLKKLPGRKSNKPSPPPTEIKKQTPEIKIDDYVRMSKDGLAGRVLAINGKFADVAFGAIRTKVELSKLIKTVKPSQTAKTQTLSVTRSTTEDSRRRQLNFNPEIDIRGMRADEALQAVMYFLDDAVQFSASKVRILHGTGTGALRLAVRQYLQSHNDVAAFHDEDVRFGGAGITVVELNP
ncbi:MAG: Smr/MutS family protein [Prevotella sp.]|nr:Smr/MutS family protein [Prevotella sp.]MCM1074681.1 Smr/MutS family protein [Ruminococcus sp.]